MTTKVKFVGIDGHNRPVFKALDSRAHYGSTNKLFSTYAEEIEVLNGLCDLNGALCYFGNSFDCEPMGTPANTTFEIITNK